MSNDRQIDPISLDYVDGPAGAFAEIDVIQNQIALAFSVDRGSWEGDPKFGNRFSELARATETVENRQRLADLGREALSFLVEDGSLSSVDAAVTQFDRGQVAFAIDAYQPGKDQPLPLPAFIVPVGGSQ